MFSDPSHFAITVSTVPRATVVAVAGELDIATGPTLGAVLDGLAGMEPDPLIFDMAQLDFVDAGGLRFIHVAVLGARSAGRPVRFRHVSDRLRLLLRITGIDQLVDIDP